MFSQISSRAKAPFSYVRHPSTNFWFFSEFVDFKDNCNCCKKMSSNEPWLWSWYWYWKIFQEKMNWSILVCGIWLFLCLNGGWAEINWKLQKNVSNFSQYKIESDHKSREMHSKKLSTIEFSIWLLFSMTVIIIVIWLSMVKPASSSGLLLDLFNHQIVTVLEGNNFSTISSSHVKNVQTKKIQLRMFWYDEQYSKKKWSFSEILSVFLQSSFFSGFMKKSDPVLLDPYYHESPSSMCTYKSV